MKNTRTALLTTSLAWAVLMPLSLAQPQARPPRTFATHCSICHGGNANGTDRAPGILPYVTAHSDQEFSALVHTGRPDSGMPKFDFNDDMLPLGASYWAVLTEQLLARKG